MPTVRAQTVDVETPDGIADAFLARPDEGDHPGVLLFMDAIGMRPQIHRMATRLAGEGYVVLAPHLFWRAGRAPLWDDDLAADRDALMARVRPLMAELTPERAMRDAGAWLSLLGQHASGPVGLTGYCMGGGLALRTAATHPGVAAVGSFHAGRLVSDAPDSVHRLVGGITAEVYVAHADEDASMPPEAIAALEAALPAGATSELYASAHHGFTMADMPVYDEAAAERHWAALLALLGRALTPR